MKKLFKIVIWLVVFIFAGFALLIFAGPAIFTAMVSPDHRFGDKPVPAAPDYTLRAHWAAWPDDLSPAERLPAGVAPIPPANRKAAAFFLHPTTFGSKQHWVQPMDDEEAIHGTDFGTISTQASAFNGCCQVYAPRFRQSHITGYQKEEDVQKIMQLGYADTRTAFRHFLDEIGPDRPFVLASHSQGTFHLVRLIMEEVDGTPLKDRMVAAYAIGHALPSALVSEGYTEIEVCQSAFQTGCFITWDAHEADKKPSHWSEDEEQVLWNGTGYTGFAPSQRICVNPISWLTDNAPSSRKDHLGGLANWAASESIAEPLEDLVVGSVTAYCQNSSQSNWLMVNGDRDDRLKTAGIWSFFGRNLHGADYQLFWGNIRQNAIDRTEAYFDKQK